MKHLTKLGVFLIGALTFFISQVLIRLPLLDSFTVQVLFFRLGSLSSFLLVASAGFFEEGGRFLSRTFLLRGPAEKGLWSFGDSWKEALLFGLGHGLMEVLYLFLTYSGIPSNLAIYERCLALVFHMAMSVLIFSGRTNRSRGMRTLLAMVLHGLFNSLIPLSRVLGLSLTALYMVWTLIDGILILLIGKLRKKFISYEKEIS